MNPVIKRQINRTLFYLLIIIIVLIFILPPLWVIISSFKSAKEIFTIPPKLIFSPTLKNYKIVFEYNNIGLYLRNSFLVATATIILGLLLGVPTAYALSRFRIPGKRSLMAYILASRFIPPMLVMLPFFLIYNRLGLIDSIFGLILIYTSFCLSLIIWLMVPFFDEIPFELDEAAKIDGCSRWTTFFRIILPLSASGITATSIFVFIFAWNEFPLAFVLTERNARTASVSIVSFASRFYGPAWGELSAVSTLVIIPSLIFCFIIQRRLGKGLTMGALK